MVNNIVMTHVSKNCVSLKLNSSAALRGIHYGFMDPLGESFMAVKKYWKISQVVMVITSEILNLSRVAGGHE